MACAIRSGGSFRATGELAHHTLDVMHAILESSESGRHVEVASTCERPEPLEIGVTVGIPEGQRAPKVSDAPPH
jgi:hypothetical protein